MLAIIPTRHKNTGNTFDELLHSQHVIRGTCLPTHCQPTKAAASPRNAQLLLLLLLLLSLMRV
jgi:hypothetical protein